MITRQGFEHQKDINLEAYTLGLVQRVDINFRIDYKGGVLDSVSQLPVSGNTVNDAFFVRDNINNRVYIWDGAAWVVDQASTTPGGGVQYTTAPTTTGNRIIQSIGVNADLIQETLIEVDPMTGDILFPSTIDVTFESDVNNVGNTITNDGTTTNNINGSEENWDNTTVINNNGGTINNNGTNINNDNITENYTNSTINYDNTTNVDIANLNVTNLTISGGNVIVNVATDKDNQTYNGTDPTRVLPTTPLSEDALHITTSSGTNLILGVDYSVSGDTITWILNPNTGEDIYARWLRTGALTGSSGPTTITSRPEPLLPVGNNDFANGLATNDTIAIMSLFKVSENININQLSFISSINVGTANTERRFGIYSEDGQTKIAEIDTGVISVGTTPTNTYITLGSTVSLVPGNYYIGYTQLTSVNSRIYSYRPLTISGVQALASGGPGKAVFVGELTIAGGVMPLTFDPTTLTVGSETPPIIRLDN